MDIDETIRQLRRMVPEFENRVAGAAEYSAARDVSTFPGTSAYVIRLEDEADPTIPGMNDLNQMVTEKVGVVIQVGNSADRRGQAAADLVMPLRTSIFAALLNWRPGLQEMASFSPLPPMAYQAAPMGNLFYMGGRLLDMDRARLFWQFDFGIRTLITASDGFHVTAEELAKLLGDAIDPDTGLAMGLEMVFPVVTES